MHRVMMLWMTLTVAIDGQNKNYISKRDSEFVGPDKRLEQLLKQRMSPPSYVVDELRSLENTLPVSASPSPQAKLFPFQGDTRRTYFSEYNAEHLKIKIIQFQQHLIQLSKGFIEEIEPLVEKFQMDERARVANIFAKLKQWLQRIRTLLQATLLERYQKHHLYYSPHTRRVIIHFYYYQHMLRTHIDITYTIEFLIYIHTNYMNFVKRKNKTSSVDDEDDDDMEEAKEETLTNVYEKLQGKDVDPDHQKYYLQMFEQGLQPTIAP